MGLSDTCTLRMDSAKDVSATFEPILAPIQIRREGDAANDGVVTGASGAIACPSQCTTSLPVGAAVTLNASTSINTAVFTGWPSGPCLGQGAQCTFTAQEGLPPVAAEFSVNRLTVSTVGQPGRVTSNLGGIDCGATCTAVLPVGTSVVLTATPDNDDVRFSAWTGPCAGQGTTCTFTQSGPEAVQATFIVRPPPVTNHQPADLVLGQPSFTADLPNNGGESLSTLNRPRYCHTDGTRLWVSDGDNARVLQWNTLPAQPFMQPASVVIGQSSPTTHTAGTTQTTFETRPGNIVAIQGRLYAADFNSNRVLMWSAVPTAHGAPAAAVIGQTSFVGSAGGLGADRFARPYTIAAGPSGGLIVVDTFNHRVLGFDPTPSTTGLTGASLVLGQFTLSGTPTFDQNANPAPPDAGSMHYPFDATYDPVSDRLFVVDTNNHRVLGWTGYPTTPRPADFVIGQTSFSASAANAGQASTNAVGLDGPRVAAVHAGSLFVADGGNSRVMVWTPVPGQTGEPARAVLGQVNLTSRGPRTSANDLSSPWGICGSGAQLFVVDINDNRVLRFALSP